MGKASKWFRSILGHKKSDSHLQLSSFSYKPPHPHSHRDKHLRENDSFAPATIKHSANSDSIAMSPLHGRQQQGRPSVSVVDANGDSEVPDRNKRSIAVAVASAAAAELAVAAANAATAVVRLTSHNSRYDLEPETQVNTSCRARQKLAAIKIQSVYRGHLARRALRALKGLVRMQALVRGYIQRKRTAGWLQEQMQVLLRAQALARACRCRAQISDSSKPSTKASHSHPVVPSSNSENSERVIRSKSSKYLQPSMQKKNGSKNSSGRTFDNHEKIHSVMNQTDRRNRIDEQSRDQRVQSTNIGPMDDSQNDKNLKFDTGKPNSTSKGRNNLFQSSHLAPHSDLYSCSSTNSGDSHQTTATTNPSSGGILCLSPLKVSDEIEGPFCTADNYPLFYSASPRRSTLSKGRSLFTPANSTDGSRSSYSSTGYSDNPKYMAHTECSKTKLRSLSAKQRPAPHQYERSTSTKTYSNSFHASKLLKHTHGQVA